MSDELKQTGTVRTETYWALVDTLYEARIENHEKATRIAELESLLRSVVLAEPLWLPPPHPLDGTEYDEETQDEVAALHNLSRRIAAALTPEEPK